MIDTDMCRLLQHLDELLDREAIRMVLYDYCRAADCGDAALMKSCYHPDGSDDHGFFVGRGWDFVDYVPPILAQLERSIHSMSNPHIVLEGDKAYGESQWSIIHRLHRLGTLARPHFRLEKLWETYRQVLRMLSVTMLASCVKEKSNAH